MKKILVFTTLLVGMSLTANAKIQDTYKDITIGKTTYWDLLGNSPKSEEGFLTWTVNRTHEKIIYWGKYLVDDIYMHSLIVELLNDTVYKLTFDDACFNIDNSAFYKNWFAKEREKYAQYIRTDTTKYDSIIPDEEKHYIQKSDGFLEVSASASDYGARIVFANPEMEKRAMEKEVDELVKEFSKMYNPDDVVKGVAGVKFGDNEETVKKAISRKSSAFLSDKDHCLTYLNTALGGTTFDYSNFYFKQGKGLVSVSMYKAFPTYKKKQAEEIYENIVSLYRGKYSNVREVNNEEDDKFTACGEPDSQITDETTPPIWIKLEKSVSKGGDYMYYVKVDYYIANTLNLYNEDI